MIKDLAGNEYVKSYMSGSTVTTKQSALPKQCPSCGGGGCGTPCEYGDDNPLCIDLRAAIGNLKVIDEKECALNTWRQVSSAISYLESVYEEMKVKRGD